MESMLVVASEGGRDWKSEWRDAWEDWGSRRRVRRYRGERV
jgi:hypothetical protein